MELTLPMALDILEQAAKDPAMRMMIADRLGMIDETAAPRKVAAPLPAISEMTAIQAAIFDNWPHLKPVKGYPCRFALALEIWTAPGPEINIHLRGNCQHKCSVALMNADQLQKWVQRTRRQNPNRKNPLDPAYLDTLESVSGEMTDDDLVGVCAASVHSEGTVYFNDQWVMVRMDDVDTTAGLSVRGDSIALAEFDTETPNGNPFGGSVILQSRTDLVGFSATWATRSRHLD